MKCPLLMIPISTAGAIDRGKSDECLKEDCAWWNGHNNECCFISTGKVLNAISTYLYEIKEKMPHAGQSTK